MDFIAFSLIFQYARVGLAKHGRVKTFAKTFGRFFHFLFNFFVVFSQQIFDQHIGAIAFFAVFVVYQWIVEGIHMTRSFPGGGVHKDGSINSHHIFMQQRHAVPPVFFQVVFQFNPVLTVIVHGTQAVVNLARREYKSVFLTVSYQFFENIFL